MAARPNTAQRKANPKSKRTGRPTKYRPEMCDVVIAQGKLGKSLTAMANKLGIHRETLYAWRDEHPDFSDALKVAQGHSLEWWETTMQGQARGRYEGANATSLIFALKNQHHELYKDRREIDHSGELKLVELNFEGYQDDDDDED